MSPDLINGLFELLGGILLFRNCWLTYKAKTVKGVSVVTTTFFASWGAFNLWFYPSLALWWSFAGGCVIMIANVFWIALMLHYSGALTKMNHSFKYALGMSKRKMEAIIKGVKLPCFYDRTARKSALFVNSKSRLQSFTKIESTRWARPQMQAVQRAETKRLHEGKA